MKAPEMLLEFLLANAADENGMLGKVALQFLVEKRDIFLKEKQRPRNPSNKWKSGSQAG